MKLPKTVKVGWRTYEIELGEHKSGDSGGDLYGEIGYVQDKIWLYQGQSDENKLVTLLHEILHGIFFITGHKDRREDEELICSLSENLYQIIKDNPGLFAVAAKTQSAPVEVTHVGV